MMIQIERLALPAQGVVCQRGQTVIVGANRTRFIGTYHATARVVGVLERTLRKS